MPIQMRSSVAGPAPSARRVLLAPLPLRNLLEGLDVPADELRERDGGMLFSFERSRVLELHLAMLRPGERG